MATQIQSGLATGTEGLVCFVCGVGVVGRYYTLATCRTQTTKVRLIEKLGQLVGDDYMVIISEEDVICRGCATMINSLDRLEKEVGSLRSIVLRYLEKKYDMEDGELVNAQSNHPASSAIPPSQSKQAIKDSTIKPDSPTSFYARKRKFMEESNEELKETIARDGKDGSWLQCNRCKYTTPASTSVDENTLTNSIKNDNSKTLTSIETVNHDDKMNGEEPNIVTSKQTLQELSSNYDIKKESSEDIVVTPPQQVDLITNQITEDQFVDAVSVNTDNTIATTTGMEMVTGGKQVTLQAVEAEDGTNTICMVDENGMIVQKVEQAEDGTLYVQMADNSADPTKQVLSVAEDGSVQMVEVLWDDMVTSDDGTTMVTF